MFWKLQPYRFLCCMFCCILESYMLLKVYIFDLISFYFLKFFLRSQYKLENAKNYSGNWKSCTLCDLVTKSQFMKRVTFLARIRMHIIIPLTPCWQRHYVLGFLMVTRFASSVNHYLLPLDEHNSYLALLLWILIISNRELFCLFSTWTLKSRLSQQRPGNSSWFLDSQKLNCCQFLSE